MNALNRPNVDLYTQLLRGTSQEHLLAESWYVHVFNDHAKANFNSLAWQIRQQRDVPLEVVMDEELFKIEPALSCKGQARAGDPGAVGKTLFDKAAAFGAKFQQVGVSALQPRDSDGWTLQTEAGAKHCKQLVLATGAWSAKLLKPLSYKLPLEAGRGYHLVIHEPVLK